MPESPPSHQVSIVACARWETEAITEWLLYHRSIGFDHVYLYCNDDDPAELYAEVLPFLQGDNPFVTFRHYPFQGQQFHMYMHCLRAHKDESEWVMFLDVDEFLCIRGSNSIKAFLRDVPEDWDSISFNWQMFGNSGHKRRPSGSVLLNYTQREAELKFTCKTLTRTAAIELSRIEHKTFIWHHWEDAVAGGMRRYNVLGVPVAEVRNDDEGRSYIADEETRQRIYDRAVVYHYAFKAEADYLMRAERGSLGEFIGQARYRGVHEAGQAAQNLRPLNMVRDTTLADYWRGYLGRAQATRVIPPPRSPNLALGKPADQSSVSDWSLGRTTTEDAAGAVNGRITGGHQFHTQFEASPWWSVDLLGIARIEEIRVYNRVDSVGCARRLRYFFIETSPDGADWSMVYAKHDESMVGGADGSPLLVRFDEPIAARFVKLTAVDSAFLHFDQVEIYGEAEIGFADDERDDMLAVPGAAGPVVHVASRGRLANRMMQFMAAHALAARVPGCRISGVDLPDWGISKPVLPRPDGLADSRVVRISPLDMRIDIAGLSARLRSGEVARVEIDSYAQHLHNFLPAQAYREIFQPPVGDVEGFGPDQLAINIRGGEILQAAHPDYTLIPVEFYTALVAETGLRPVFMGQIGANPYVGRLRRAFPEAPFIPSRGPMRDFEIIRRSRNVVVSVSTFSWLAAWLSEADRIFLPMTGFYNPAQFPEIDLLPLDDPRYRFYLFPVNYAVPVEQHEAAHRALGGAWRYMRPEMIEELRGRRPRFGSPAQLFHAAFDEDFYLRRYQGLREAVERGAFKSGFEHYVMFGYFERRDPFPLDKVWYGRQYPLAAIEVGQGDFADFHHHYLAVGRERGYAPLPTPVRREGLDEHARRLMAAGRE
jgi:hypothetical protein